MIAFGRFLRAASVASRVRAIQQVYSSTVGAQAIQGWQLARLNATWTWTVRHIPYYRCLVEQGVPARFRSWREFAETVPVMARRDAQEHVEKLCTETEPGTLWLATGGSTYEPMRFPVSRQERRFLSGGLWSARARYGIRPSDRCFLLWGHAHIFGRGLSGKAKAQVRSAKDKILGYKRWSAYDLSLEQLDNATRALSRFAPDYIVGYSRALELWADSIERPLSIRPLKRIIATAEAFSSEESRRNVEDKFGVPVVMEYGSVESTLIAYDEGRGYDVLWHQYHLEAVNTASDGSGEAVVTSLYPKSFPLMRYAIGDRISGCTSAEDGVIHFDRIAGRVGDMLVVRGAIVHSEAFTHAIRACTGVLGFQLVVREEQLREVRLVLAPSAECAVVVHCIKGNLSKLDPTLSQLSLVIVQSLTRTIAGKCPLVVVE